MKLPLAPPPSGRAIDNNTSNRFVSSMASNFMKSGDENKLLKGYKPEKIRNISEKKALDLFHLVSRRVPAYKDFLAKNNVSPSKIRSISDFQRIPIIDKDNYIYHYPIESRCWDGSFSNYQTIAVSSGSTGVPLCWPRDIIGEYESNIIHEIFLQSNFDIKDGQTLALVGFSMGIYTAGLLTSVSLQQVSQKGYPLLVVTPGISLSDWASALKAMGNKVKRIIIFSYPSMIRDFLEQFSLSEELDSRETELIFVPAGEKFSEEWRDYIKTQTSQFNTKILSLYGCSEKAILGYETIGAVNLRRYVQQNMGSFQEVFSGFQAIPNIYQYYPFLRYFESVNEHLVMTATGGTPLVRYDLKDIGGVLEYTDVMKIWKENDMNNPGDKCITNLPFLYVKGREETITLYGLNIYPDNIRCSLEQGELFKITSGRFSMEVKFDSQQRQTLHVYIELSRGGKECPEIKQKIYEAVLEALKRKNSEYNTLIAEKGEYSKPCIHLLENGDPRFVTKGGKSKA